MSYQRKQNKPSLLIASYSLYKHDKELKNKWPLKIRIEKFNNTEKDMKLKKQVIILVVIKVILIMAYHEKVFCSYVYS